MAINQEILSKIAEIVNDVAGVPVEDVKPEKSFVDDLDIDSLSMVEIVYSLQEAFSVDIPDDDVKSLRTVQDAVDYIEKAQKKA
ncbi:Acyl carrier protein [Propionibacterium freudenreichii]|jgi:acyl carrier protein|uniref:acyl carrier protein n=1 Tax=Propionibacterium freudenreichii TaxID=1744 RepID=UPI0005419BC7|nr:acyl carrier protein [Propionibacterium freudenreichii]CEG93117.1 Acyl carrier protein (ACP) [Propionibacterium freudenreichii]SBN60215.1 Acyl carrier protein [Propionibacterium freudenreichii]SCQ48749.1 Acyl carrier protein [Propionibacterium freudenreichii]SCQ53900.1 Acyl carrier protein [Propionibacterium freudenreichii]